jgi:DNA-binding transcriptional LysR family regulator
MVQHCFDSGQLVPVLQEWSPPAMPVQIMYPPKYHQRARLKVFIG